MNAVFCGDGTLLIRCAEVFTRAGGRVEAVVTTDARISAWATENATIAVTSPDDPALAAIEFDWLFSVANTRILPARLLDRARLGAVNFHDGPLPRYAGLNVPVWALLAGEARHAVTWHEMTGPVDTGRIVAERVFDIASDETAFSLNAKCYEAGLAAFGEFVDAIVGGTLAARAQEGERRLFTRAMRPANLGLVDPHGPAATLTAMVRALDFGGYENPLGAAKLWTGREVLAVRQAEPAGPATAPAGTVVAVDPHGVLLATADGLVRLSGLTDMRGGGAAPQAGMVLPALAGLADADIAAVGRDEAQWEAALAGAAPAWPPFPQGDVRPDAQVAEASIEAQGLDADALCTAFAAWLARLSDTDRVSLSIWSPAGHPVLSDLRPVDVVPGALTGAAELARLFAKARQTAAERAPMAADLALRIVDPAQRGAAFQALSLVVAAGADAGLTAVPGRLTLVTDRPRLVATGGLFTPQVMAAMAASLSAFIAGIAAGASAATAPLAAAGDRRGPALPLDNGATVHGRFLATASRRPDAVALEAGEVRLTFAELVQRSGALAGALAARGAGPGTVVGVCLGRSADLVIALLAVLRTGAAYLPLDPGYPADRIAFMAADSGAALIVADRSAAQRHGLAPDRVVDPSETGPFADGPAGRLAYLIYTSGSTGQPKGVMVPHRAVINFFDGMDALIPMPETARLLSVTSVSFDISVLELFWTLARGATVVLQTDEKSGDIPGFSLFYFASEASGTGHHAYRLLIEGAKFADANGFEAIWTPERHFHAFGGLYPNPAISSAMVAGLTKNVKLRAGSSVVPLHHPIRVAEDWALVDNLSNGRAGIAIASGWQPNDFVIRPYAFEDRKQKMLDAIDLLRKLWKGEAVEFPNHKGEPVAVEIHPKPMQKDLPLWITAAGNPETFVAAGEKGCGVLTHLLGQTFEEVADKIAMYRDAWARAGHAGQGRVTLMLHTFIGDNEDFVRETVRQPMKGYLKSAVDLVKRASWTFPTIVERATAAGMSPQEMFEREELSPGDLDALLDHAFERYYRTSGLFGTPDSTREIVRKVAEIGVDEIACLIDFGIDTDLALANLPNIKRLMDGLVAEGGAGRRATVAEEIAAREVTHLQCTPSMASILAADAAGRAALGRLDTMMVGGEALAPDLGRDLVAAVRGRVFNMYGPTETTIWSAVAELAGPLARVPLGEPIVNTVLSVRTGAGTALPDMAAGELWIGGEGVTDGYWQRPDLTAERFVERDGLRFYRTGDLVRRGADGALEFLGRIDNQVKIRGHRIELGEIEAALSAQPGVRQAIVSAVTFGPGDIRLVGYVTAERGARPEADALREALGDKLPEVMVPSTVVVLEQMPMTPNGKIDRRALPHPVAEATAPVAAEGDLETSIARIWSEALGLPAVDVTRNFFDLGGHSLLVVQVQRRMKEMLGREIAITDVFRFPTVRGLAAHLGDAGSEAPDAASRGAARAAARLARRGARV